ncbi:anion permease [Sporomusa ovata]|uniref:anion permease n=1 Tax=Sporomusa ovata TaxID=2378 RepID=UPI003D15C3A2
MPKNNDSKRCLAYSTGPTPIFFGSGYISQGTWWRTAYYVHCRLPNFISIGSMWWKFLKLW